MRAVRACTRLTGISQAGNDIGLDHDQQRHHLMEQNARLLRMAKDQANHKPEDVALQQELGALRIDILDQKLQAETFSQPPAFPTNAPNGNQALHDYQMRLRLLEQQNCVRLAMAGRYQEGRLPLPILRRRRIVEDGRLRSLEVQARHCRAGRPDAELTRETSKAKTLVQELQGRIEDAVLRNAAQDFATPFMPYD